MKGPRKLDAADAEGPEEETGEGVGETTITGDSPVEGTRWL